MVTLTDEGTLDAGVSRASPTEDLCRHPRPHGEDGSAELGSGSVYSATVNTYNARDQVTLTIPGVLQKTYDYHSDGRMDHAFDQGDNRYDRRYRFDQTGRVNEATSGAEARGTGAMDGPYSSAITYDFWGNTTQKNGQHWTAPTSESATYVNNRRSGWTYDASGNMLDDGTYQALERKYDAAGRMAQIIHPAFPGNPKRTDDYDGDGQRVKSGYHQPGCSPEFLCPFEYFYYLRSSVLGGESIAEIGQNGQRREVYVYAPSGSVVAKPQQPIQLSIRMP